MKPHTHVHTNTHRHKHTERERQTDRQTHACTHTLTLHPLHQIPIVHHLTSPCRIAQNYTLPYEIHCSKVDQFVKIQYLNDPNELILVLFGILSIALMTASMHSSSSTNPANWGNLLLPCLQMSIKNISVSFLNVADIPPFSLNCDIT